MLLCKKINKTFIFSFISIDRLRWMLVVNKSYTTVFNLFIHLR